jgi:hypothetical protein
MVRVLILSHNSNLQIARVQCATVEPTSHFQTNYAELYQEAEKQRGRLISLRKEQTKPKG